MELFWACFSGLGVVTGFFSGLETCTYRAFTAWLMGGLGRGLEVLQTGNAKVEEFMA